MSKYAPIIKIIHLPKISPHFQVTYNQQYRVRHYQFQHRGQNQQYLNILFIHNLTIYIYMKRNDPVTKKATSLNSSPLGS